MLKVEEGGSGKLDNSVKKGVIRLEINFRQVNLVAVYKINCMLMRYTWQENYKNGSGNAANGRNENYILYRYNPYILRNK